MTHTRSQIRVEARGEHHGLWREHSAPLGVLAWCCVAFSCDGDSASGIRDEAAQPEPSPPRAEGGARSAANTMSAVASALDLRRMDGAEPNEPSAAQPSSNPEPDAGAETGDAGVDARSAALLCQRTEQALSINAQQGTPAEPGSASACGVQQRQFLQQALGSLLAQYQSLDEGASLLAQCLLEIDAFERFGVPLCGAAR